MVLSGCTAIVELVEGVLGEESFERCAEAVVETEVEKCLDGGGREGAGWGGAEEEVEGRKREWEWFEK